MPLDRWQEACAGLPVAGLKVFPSATVRKVAATRSQEWKNPAADILLLQDGQTTELRLLAAHEQQVPLKDGRTLLAIENRTDETKAFRSDLAILEGDRKVAAKTVVVNDPRPQGSFYQSTSARRIRPIRPQVVGIGSRSSSWASAVSLGVVFIYYVRPVVLG